MSCLRGEESRGGFRGAARPWRRCRFVKNVFCIRRGPRVAANFIMAMLVLVRPHALLAALLCRLHGLGSWPLERRCGRWKC